MGDIAVPHTPEFSADGNTNMADPQTCGVGAVRLLLLHFCGGNISVGYKLTWWPHEVFL